VAPRVARPGVEAAAWLVPLAVAGRAQAAAWVVAPTVAVGRQAALITEKSLSLEPQDHVLFVKVLVTDLECRAFNSESLEAKRTVERLGRDLAGGHG